ncbi:unnamed protein product [Ectocarpus sp. CCAP 1310/34]|nr:unnamed protein product [Ectocarpus sp. CCAP 1310/34]
MIFSRLMLSTSSRGLPERGLAGHAGIRPYRVFIQRRRSWRPRKCSAPRTQELHEQFVTLAVITTDHDLDPANVIHDMRRICTESCEQQKKTRWQTTQHFAFLKALPDVHEL